jgi:hypothetical protein
MITVVQAPASVCRNRDDVFDPYPEPASEIDPGLDREAHTWQQRLLLTLDEVRRFMSGYSDAVAGAVNELLAIAASLITLLAARSISWQLTPGRTASTPACCASRTTS